MEMFTGNAQETRRFIVFKNQLVDWIVEYKNILLYSIMALIALLFICFQFTAKLRGKAEADYLKLNASFKQWIQSPSSNPEILNIIKTTINKHPEVHPTFDGLIAEKLLNKENAENLDFFVQPMFKRVGRICPYHTRFAETSLLLAQERWEVALAESDKLKSDMENDPYFDRNNSLPSRDGCILYAYNLLRIAFLNKKMQLVNGELSAWEEIERNAGAFDNASRSVFADREAYQFLERNFTTGSISLFDYIQYRKDQLSRSSNRA